MEIKRITLLKSHVVSKPQATIRVQVIEMPEEIKKAISISLNLGRQVAKKERGINQKS